jgi:hypothetical protein
MELVHDADFATREQARTALFEYIEVFYNRQRRHPSLGYLSPVDFELAALPQAAHRHGLTADGDEDAAPAARGLGAAPGANAARRRLDHTLYRPRYSVADWRLAEESAHAVHGKHRKD